MMSSGSLKRWDNQVTRISAATCGTSVSLLSLQSPGLPRESHPIDMWNKKLRGRLTRLAGIRAASSDRRATKKYKENGGRHGSTRSAEAHCGKGGTPMGTKAPGTGSCLEEFTIRGAEHDCDRSPGHPPRETCAQIAARRSSIDAVRATTKPLSAPHQRSHRRQLFPP